MSYTNGYQTLVQSMNGLLTFNDGAGVVIENGTIIAPNLAINNILASVITASCSLWSNVVGVVNIAIANFTTGIVSIAGQASQINIGGLASQFIYIGSATNNTQVGNMRFISGQIYPNAGQNMVIGFGSPSALTYNASNNNTTIGDGQTASNTLTLGTSTNVNTIGNIKITGNAITSTITTNDIGIYQDATSTKGVFIGNLNNPNSIGAFLINRLGNGGSLLPNFDTATVSQEMVIGSNNASQIWMGNTNANSQITTRGLVQINNGMRIFQTNFWLSTPPQIFTNKAVQNETGGQFNSNLNGLNELDLVCYSGTSASLSGLAIYSTNTSTNPVATTATLVSATLMNKGLRLYTGGIAFDKGNLTSSTSTAGYYTQTGQDINRSTNIPANTRGPSSGSYLVTYPTQFPFGAVPNVTVTIVSDNTAGLTCNLLVVGVAGFEYCYFNSRSTATGAGNNYTINWTATGKYA